MNLPKPDILIEDGAVFVMNKPGGLLTQGPPGIDSLELRTKQFLKSAMKNQERFISAFPIGSTAPSQEQS